MAKGTTQRLDVNQTAKKFVDTSIERLEAKIASSNKPKKSPKPKGKKK